MGYYLKGLYLGGIVLKNIKKLGGTL